ncbi:hypothetical protein D3C75_1045630 [compost metagenome]
MVFFLERIRHDWPRNTVLYEVPVNHSIYIDQTATHRCSVVILNDPHPERPVIAKYPPEQSYSIVQ